MYTVNLWSDPIPQYYWYVFRHIVEYLMKKTSPVVSEVETLQDFLSMCQDVAHSGYLGIL